MLDKPVLWVHGLASLWGSLQAMSCHIATGSYHDRVCIPRRVIELFANSFVVMVKRLRGHYAIMSPSVRNQFAVADHDSKHGF
jgi:hypothetical protein